MGLSLESLLQTDSANLLILFSVNDFKRYVEISTESFYVVNNESIALVKTKNAKDQKP